MIIVCSTTLFIGKVPKTSSEEELREEIEKYGKVESINVSFLGIKENNLV